MENHLKEKILVTGCAGFIGMQNKEALENVFKSNSIDKVVNLAAQAGVRYSLENPNSYIKSNVLGFMNILECCRHYDIKGLIYGSSVYEIKRYHFLS